MYYLLTKHDASNNCTDLILTAEEARKKTTGYKWVYIEMLEHYRINRAGCSVWYTAEEVVPAE